MNKISCWIEIRATGSKQIFFISWSPVFFRFIKNAGKKLQEDLEFDDSIYFEDDDTDDLDRLEGVDQQSESQDEEEKEEE